MFSQRYFLEVDNGDDEDDEMDEGIPTEEGNAKDENMYFVCVSLVSQFPCTSSYFPSVLFLERRT